MTKVLAPVLPHLAEEITATLHGPDAPSVFTSPWAPLVRIASCFLGCRRSHLVAQPDEYIDPQAEADMSQLFRIRDKVFALLERRARTGKCSAHRRIGRWWLTRLCRHVKSSLSADLALNITSAATSDVIDLLGREGAPAAL